MTGLFIYDQMVINVLLAFGNPKYNYRTISGVALELGIEEKNVVQIMNSHAFLFLENTGNPGYYCLNMGFGHRYTPLELTKSLFSSKEKE